MCEPLSHYILKNTSFGRPRPIYIKCGQKKPNEMKEGATLGRRMRTERKMRNEKAKAKEMTRMRKGRNRMKRKAGREE